MVTTTGKVYWPSQIHTNWMTGSTFLRISLRKYDDILGYRLKNEVWHHDKIATGTNQKIVEHSSSRI